MNRNIYSFNFFMSVRLIKKHSLGIIAFVLFGLSFPAQAQQDPGFSQFMFNKLPINPAYAGGRDMLSIRMQYRDQWTAIEGHPRTLSLSINSPFYNDNIAIGGGLIYDQVGLITNTRLFSSYAYRFKINPSGKQKMKISLGINAGMTMYSADLSKVNPVENGDPTFRQDLSLILPEIGSGLYFSGSNFYFGLSVPNIITSDLNKENDSNVSNSESSFKVPHLFSMTGGVIPLNEQNSIQLRPQVLVKTIISKKYNAPVQVDANLSLLMYDKVNVGITYRVVAGNRTSEQTRELNKSESLNFMLELWPIRSLLIGYVYDLSISELRKDNKGTHEVVIGYDIIPKKKKGTAIGCYHF